MKLMSKMLVIALAVGVSQFAAGQVAVGQGQQPTDRAQEQQRRDQLRAAVQGICPVSGGKLGSMGDPIKVKVGQETVFLCCKGCLKQKIKPQHWAAIHANIARAQRICPVMKKGFPKNPKWTVVEGQVVYLCCPGCDKKIAANPQKYLRDVDQLYLASLESRKNAR